MALTNNFIPSTSLVFTPRDFAKQLADKQAEDRNAVQGAFKFATQLYDFDKSNQQADLMEKDSRSRQALQDQLLSDSKVLEELKKELAALKGA